MNNKINNKQAPEKAIQLLPWYALGLLSPEESDYVKEALLEFPELEHQLQDEIETIAFLKNEEDIFYLSAIDSSEKRLEHLLKNEEFKNNNQELLKQKNTVKLKLLTFVRSLTSGGLSGYQYLGFASISTLSIALLFAFVAPLLDKKNTFYPAYTGSIEERKATQKNTLLVGLNVSPDDPKLIALLKGISAETKEVPGKEGMYRISFPKKISSSELKKILQELSANKELIWFVGEAY